MHLVLDGLNAIKRNGDVVPISTAIGNDNSPGACDVTDATLTLRFPNPDGTPGPTVTLAEHLNLPAGTPPRPLPTQNFTPNFSAGVFRGQVTLAISGTQHFAGGDTTGPIGSLGAPIVVSKPHATLTVTPTPSTGSSPLSVTYHYSVLNDSPNDPMNVPVNMLSPVLSDDMCASPTFTGGDTNSDTLLTAGETWTYTCSTSFFGGSYTNHAAVVGTSARDGRPWPTVAGQSTVTVDGPDMTLAKSHTGTFTQGDTGRAYTLTASNSGNQSSTGAVTVTDTLPAGLTATAISGTGWTCTLASLACTRSDTLAAGVSYPPITVTVDVGGNAPASVTNSASLTRAGENSANNRATDPTAVAQLLPPGGGGGPGPGPTLDTLAPNLRARLTNSTFAVNRSGRSETLVTARAKKGTTFVYTLSEPARVLFAIDRREAGRKVGKKCRKTSRSNRRKRKCVRFVRAGAFAQNSATGVNRRKWSGKLRRRALKPGRYRATLIAKDAAGNASVAKRLSFRIVRR